MLYAVITFRSFKKGSEQRERLVDFVVNRAEGQGDTFLAFAERLAESDGEAGGAAGLKALDELRRLRPRITSYNVCYTKLLRAARTAPRPIATPRASSRTG